MQIMGKVNVMLALCARAWVVAGWLLSWASRAAGSPVECTQVCAETWQGSSCVHTLFHGLARQVFPHLELICGPGVYGSLEVPCVRGLGYWWGSRCAGGLQGRFGVYLLRSVTRILCGPVHPRALIQDMHIRHRPLRGVLDCLFHTLVVVWCL